MKATFLSSIFIRTTSTSSIAATEEKNSNQRNIVNQKSCSRPATMKQRTLSDQFIASADYQLTFAERIMRATHTEDTRRRQAPRRGPDGKIEGAGEQSTTRDLRTRKFAGSFENAPLYGNSILERLNYRVWTLRETFLRRNSARCIKPARSEPRVSPCPAIFNEAGFWRGWTSQAEEKESRRLIVDRGRYREAERRYPRETTPHADIDRLLSTSSLSDLRFPAPTGHSISRLRLSHHRTNHKSAFDGWVFQSYRVKLNVDFDHREQPPLRPFRSLQITDCVTLRRF